MAVLATLAWEEEDGHPRAQRGPVAGADAQFFRKWLAKTVLPQNRDMVALRLITLDYV